MKKVVNINLGGQKFTIDDDAYQALEAYLNAIEQRFSYSHGKSDIIVDIEYRLAELFIEDMLGAQIISMPMVDRVKAIMGEPKEFGEDYYASEKEAKNLVYQKRLFRDPQDKIIAGIASGLTAYYGLKSPLIFRILFLMIAFTGVGILPYILLWLFVPKARTTSDRLAMKGEPINIETIGNAVEDSLVDIKETIEDIGKTIKSKIK